MDGEKVADWTSLMADILMDSYQSLIRTGRSHTEAVEQALKDSDAGPAAREEFSRRASLIGWRVRSRTVHGLHSTFREFIVVRNGGTLVLGPFSKKADAQKQAEFMNEVRP